MIPGPGTKEDAPSIGELKEKATEIRRLILDTTHRAKMGHTGGSLSEADILAALFFKVMRHRDPSEPRRPGRDRFILSKGHASPGYYAALALAGYFSLDTLENFDAFGSILQAHPDMRKTPGVDMSSGSLGQGLSCAVGMALAAERAPEMGDSRIFVLMGDGELQEGQVWEAALYAGARHLPRIVAVVDVNGVQLASATKDAVDVEPLVDKWEAFGWSALGTDGHEMASLVDALEKARDLAAAGPVLVAAKTIKGKGVSFMEGRYEWHGKAPDDREYALALREIEK